MNASDFLENALLKHVFGVTAYTAPASVYCALSTTTPSDAGGVSEPAGGAYVRMAMTFSVSGTAPTQASNTAQVDWPQATGSWGTLSHVALYDAATGGNLLFWLPLVDPADMTSPLSKAIGSGDTFRVAAGQLRVRCD